MSKPTCLVFSHIYFAAAISNFPLSPLSLCPYTLCCIIIFWANLFNPLPHFPLCAFYAIFLALAFASSPFYSSFSEQCFLLWPNIIFKFSFLLGSQPSSLPLHLFNLDLELEIHRSGLEGDHCHDGSKNCCSHHFFKF